MSSPLKTGAQSDIKKKDSSECLEEVELYRLRVCRNFLDAPYFPFWSMIPPRPESNTGPLIDEEVGDGRRKANQ